MAIIDTKRKLFIKNRLYILQDVNENGAVDIRWIEERGKKTKNF